MADGSITFETDLDNKKLEKKLASIGGKIKKLEADLSKKKDTQSGLAKELDEAKKSALKTETAIKRLKTEMASLKNITSVDGTSNPEEYMAALDRQKTISVELKEQKTTLDQQDKETERIAGQYTKCTDQVIALTEKINEQKNEYGLVTEQIKEANIQTGGLGKAVDAAGNYLDKFTRRVKNLARRILVFSVITMALRQMRTWMGKVIESNSEAGAAMAKLKGALLTLVQPLVGVIIPAFTALVNILARVVAAVAQAMAVLFGGTIEQSKQAAAGLYQETDALGKTGAAAKKAGGQLAAFDELNKLSDNSGGGGGGSATPDFNFDTVGLESDFDKILNVVKLIGTALLAWKLTGSMEALFSKDGLMKLVGAFLAFDGAIGLARTTFDAWVNGVTWETFFGMLARSAELIGGLLLLFGPVGAAIGLLITGVTMMATAFHDAEENGWNLQNMLLAVAGILATGLGITLLTGSFIPALIAGIAAILLAITTTFGDGEKLIEDAKLILQGFLDFFVGIFTGDIDLALKGIGEIFDGLRGIVDNVLTAIKNMFSGFLDWLDEKTGGKFSGIIQFVKDLVGGAIDWMNQTFSGFATTFQQIFEGIITFITSVFTGNWNSALDGLVEIFNGAMNLISNMIEAVVNFVINGLNTVIKALNRISFTTPDWVPGIGGKHYGVDIALIPNFKIPRLAAGAVIPPNREFMAVLGDQRSGTNIEAPENLIRKIVREESGNAAVVPQLREILAAIREGKVMMVDKRILGRTVQETLSTAARTGGAASVPVR